jgi:hypothetical protein
MTDSRFTIHDSRFTIGDSRLAGRLLLDPPFARRFSALLKHVAVEERRLTPPSRRSAVELRAGDRLIQR